MTSYSSASAPPAEKQSPPTPSLRPRPPPRPIIYLLLGTPNCGKTTFLQTLTKSDPAEFHPPHHPYIIRPKPPETPSDQHHRPPSPELHFYTQHLPWSTPTLEFGLPTSTAPSYLPSPTDPSPGPDPDILLLIFSILHRPTLLSLPTLYSSLPPPDTDKPRPTLLLGLSRDCRNSIPYNPDSEELPPFVTPAEGYAMAQSMGLDRYMECSALTGELMREVEEDVVGTGVKYWIGRWVGEMERREEEGAWEGCVVG